MKFDVELRTLDGLPTAVAGGEGHSLVVDRPAASGGGGMGFDGGELLHLAVAGCISNDLFREAAQRGIRLTRVRVNVRGEFLGDPPISGGIDYTVELEGDAPAAVLENLVHFVDDIAEIPNSLRRGTPVTLHYEVAS